MLARRRKQSGSRAECRRCCGPSQSVRAGNVRRESPAVPAKGQSMTKQTITAVFDTRDHAESAALSLRQVGIPAADVTLSSEDARDELGAGTGATAEPRKTGFMASLENLFGGYEDRDTYAEGVRRGGTLLTAHVDDAHIDRVVSLLEQHGAVDLDEREETWRSEGWTGGATQTGAAATGVAGATAAGLATATSTATAPRPAASVTTAETRTTAVPAVRPAVSTATTGKDDVLQVVEERLDVGKRAVSRGKVRLHSYVVENQVAEDITLRDETVTVDRRAVDRPVAALGADAFQERTIEMEEVDEEAVVAKSARVVEEIGIRKDAVDRVETVRDTVRSTKVDVEDGRTVSTATTGLGGTFASRLVKDIDVVGSDGQHVGVVDHVDGATMKLKRMDPASGGQHHLLPVNLVKSVSADGKAMLSITAAEATRRWTAA